jgi:hypothetical protein
MMVSYATLKLATEIIPSEKLFTEEYRRGRSAPLHMKWPGEPLMMVAGLVREGFV